MQNCLGELNLSYCLIYLDDMIIFTKIEKEHRFHLHVMFEHCREHNLTLKPAKHEKDQLLGSSHLQRRSMTSKENLKAVAGFAPPQTYTEIQAFLGLVGYYWWFIKGITCIAQPLHKYLLGEGASKKNKHVTFME